MKHVSIWLAEGLAPSITARLSTHKTKLFNGLQDVQHNPRAITLTGREQGAADAAKLDATRRGGR